MATMPERRMAHRTPLSGMTVAQLIQVAEANHQQRLLVLHRNQRERISRESIEFCVVAALSAAFIILAFWR